MVTFAAAVVKINFDPGEHTGFSPVSLNGTGGNGGIVGWIISSVGVL